MRFGTQVRHRVIDARATLAAPSALCLSLVAASLLVSCGARVPTRFDPDPPRLMPSALGFDDLRAQDEVVVLVFGDSGTGSEDQYAVGGHMAEVCGRLGCDIALMLGDNFYWNGVREPRGDDWDEKFDQRFEAPYGDLDAIKFWAVAGNHDWYRGRRSVDTEIAYSRRSERWRMPSYDYAIPGLPDWLRIYALDTVILQKEVDIGQVERAEQWLCEATGWRVLMGHHAVYSSGQHGGRDGRIPFMERLVGPAIDRCGVQLLLSGHDHHQEHVSIGDFEQIIQGAAGRLRDVATVPFRTPPFLSSLRDEALARQRFAASRYGFAILEFTRTALDVTFYGYPPGQPDDFHAIHGARIPMSSRGG